MTGRVNTKRSLTGRTFSNEERAAMQERARELAADKGDGEKDLFAKIAQMPAAEQVIAKKIHEIVTKNAPSLKPKTWYGMPAWANSDGKIVCFFQSAAKFKYRYATLGFQDSANLDEGYMWPTSYALKKLTSADEAKIVNLIKRAVS